MLRIVVSSHDKGIGNFNEQLLGAKTSHCFQTVRSRQLSRVVITRAYLATRKNTRKRREKKRKMNGVEINTRAYVATRLLLRWDYLYAVTLKTKVFGDYNHARLEVSWITSTRGLLLRGPGQFPIDFFFFFFFTPQDEFFKPERSNRNKMTENRGKGNSAKGKEEQKPVTTVALDRVCMRA